MSEIETGAKPASKPVVEKAPSLARKIADFQGDAVEGKRGYASLHAHKQKYVSGVEYRFSDGEHGVPPLANLAQERGAPVREYVGREQAGREQARAMRKADGAASQSAVPKGAGASLPSDVRAKMEPRLGADLSGVKIHTGGESTKAAKGFGARAFTVGSDVHFNAGEFAPGTKEGDKLLAHELTHVVQGQKSGVQRKAEEEGGEGGAAAEEARGAEVSEPNEPAEKEADAKSEEVAEDLHGDEKKDGDKGEKKKGGQKAKGGDKKDDKKDDKAGDEKGAAEEKPAAPISAKLEGVGRKIYAAQTNGSSNTTASNTTSAAGAGAKPAEPPPPPPVTLDGTMQGQSKNLVVDKGKSEAKIDGGDAAAKVSSAQAALPPPQDPRTAKAQAALAAINAKVEALKAKLAATLKTQAECDQFVTEIRAIGVQVMNAMTEYGREFDVKSLGEPLPKFPAPRAVGYGDGDPDAAKVPDKTTRACHHVPPVQLSKSLATTIQGVADGMKETKGKRKVLTPAGQKLAQAATNIRALGHGTGLSAIFMHSTTHKNDGGAAVHQSGLAPLIEQKLTSVAENADGKRILIKNQVSAAVSVNPRSPNFEDFLEECRVQAAANVDAQKKQAGETAVKAADEQEKAVTKEAEEKAVPEAQTVLREQIRIAFNNGLDQGAAAVSIALSASFVDGDRGEHAGAIGSLRAMANSTWQPILSAAD